MNKLWNLAIFIFCINIASGIFINQFGLTGSNIGFDNSALASGNLYNVDTNSSGTPVQTPTIAPNTLFDWVGTFLNLLTFGFLVDILNFFTQYVFGASTLLFSLIPGLPHSFYLMLNGVLGVMYTFAFIQILTGKKINNKS